jgi:hypothetical protein
MIKKEQIFEQQKKIFVSNEKTRKNCDRQQNKYMGKYIQCGEKIQRKAKNIAKNEKYSEK